MTRNLIINAGVCLWYEEHFFLEMLGLLPFRRKPFLAQLSSGSFSFCLPLFLNLSLSPQPQLPTLSLSLPPSLLVEAYLMKGKRDPNTEMFDPNLCTLSQLFALPSTLTGPTWANRRLQCPGADSSRSLLKCSTITGHSDPVPVTHTRRQRRLLVMNVQYFLDLQDDFSPERNPSGIKFSVTSNSGLLKYVLSW